MKPNADIKAVFVDVDGTLLTSNQTVDPRTIESIRKLRAKGILFGLATGRDATSCEKLIESHWHLNGLVDLIVGTSGAALMDNIKHTYSSSYPLSGELIKSIMDHFKDMPINFCIPDQGILVGPTDDDLLRGLAKADNVPYRVEDYTTYLYQKEHSKLIIICNPEDMDAVINRAATFHNDAFRSQGLKTCAILYEYMDSRVSKTSGIEQIIKPYGLTMDNVMVFGDEDNDIDMLKNAAIGIVMANGSTNAKNAADETTESNDDNGIGGALDRYFNL